MRTRDLQRAVHAHKLWLDDPSQRYAHRMCLSCKLDGVDLQETDLQYASFRGSSLNNANLSGTGLYNACLSNVPLIGANLSGADLCGAALDGAIFTNSNLEGTCLDPTNVLPEIPNWELSQHELELINHDEEERIYGWRTETSRVVGFNFYTLGEHVAPWFSTDANSACHPGIYMASSWWIYEAYGINVKVVRCYSLRCDLLHAGDKWRTRRLVVISNPMSWEDRHNGVPTY